MDQLHKEKIGKLLREKGVNQPCPRCASLNFEIVGQTLLPLNDSATAVTLGGPAVNSAIVACSKCGFITLHALSALNRTLME